MQSHEKSSILEHILDFKLPKGFGTVTICPINTIIKYFIFILSKKKYNAN